MQSIGEGVAQLTVVSVKIRFTRIFAGVPEDKSSNDSGFNQLYRIRRFLELSIVDAMYSKP